MRSKDKMKKWELYVWATWAVGLLACFSAYLWLPILLTSAFDGESFSHLNKIVAKHHLKSPDTRTAQFYKKLALSFSSRVIFLYLVLGGLTASLLTRWRSRVCSFFLTPTLPINLAVFRIVVFATALNFPLWKQLQLFEAPFSALDPPPIWNAILGPSVWFPSSHQFLIMTFQALCFLALVGYKTRATTLAATVLGFYVLGVPQFFGKINHYHHLWAFMLYCSFSPSGDSLSIDSWLSNEKHEPSSKYRWPLAWAGLTIGILYFYPGLWKILVSGSDWVFTDNLQNKLYAKWFESGFQPLFRIDHYPWMLKIGALHTIAFELLFVFALFHKYTRWMAISSAFIFHHFTLLFMGIYFDTLVPMFVCFVDWPAIVKKGQKLHLPNLYIPEATGLAWLRKEEALGISTATAVQKTDRFNGLGYTELSGSKWIPLIYCSLMLISGAILFDSWPIGTYPTFAGLEKPYTKSVYIEQVDLETGKIVNEFVPLKNQNSLNTFSYSGNLQSFMMNFVASKNTTKKQSMAMSLLLSLDLKPRKKYQYQFFLAEFMTKPDVPPPLYNKENASLIFQLDWVPKK